MKLTSKTTKEQMTNYLNETYKAVQKVNKNLSDRIAYTAKAWSDDKKKVTTSDLRGLVKEVLELDLTVQEEKPLAPVNEVKKPAATGKKSTLKKSTPKDEPKKEETPVKETTAKKAGATKANKAKEETASVSTLEPTNSKTLPLAKMFTEELKTDDGVFKIAHDIKTMEDITKSVEKDEALVFAFYWTERHLKQFGYMSDRLVAPKSFVNDLDLSVLMFVSDSGTIAYAVSSYTDGLYAISPEHLEEFEGLRMCDGIEYQIYRLVE